MGKRAAAAAVLCGVALIGGCGKDPGEPSFRRAAGKSDAPDMPTPLLPDTPAPFLIEPIPPNILGPPIARPFEPLRVGGKVIAPVELARVEPDCHGLPGVVLAELIVSESGAVEAGRVLTKVSPEAKVAILAAVRQWRFRPATFKESPVRVYFTVTLLGCP